MKQVLDKGYVRLVDVMGSDLTVVNAARVSYAKASDSLNERDIKLIKFLAREGHTSPFRHAVAQFEVYAPLMVARQWWKYVVGSSHQEATGDSLDAWNESSRRYITEEPTFYIPQPDEWRTAPENSKQGSGSPLNEYEGELLTGWLMECIQKGEDLYERAIKRGVAPEQARLFLPAYGMYVRWYWTASLQSICHFLAQRLEHDAQKEIQEYAKAILELIKPHFPVSVEELL
ncbi:thymidylate synthase (FAD) [Shouchella clausii]|uniref:FAD-dependent thymidylate synthase n=1 Tax=Shouchella clausii TaxID=79880 RepID=UPI000BA67B20|nr:FAD-dependent thymidylate synthase [Shouchella clausii]PAF08699.1 thymidylate synthase (FAD) [Shouchella clausii]